jgi:GMP synthase-like glutamine amidotransferase
MLVLEHEDDSGAELLADAAVHRGFALHIVNAATSTLPSVDTYDAVLVLGSAESVCNPAIGSWFAAELAMLRMANAAGIPVFGVCFGAQALAVALGGSVRRASRPEIGWVTVATEDLAVIAPGPWFQWHTDAITPPAGATILATTDVCVQAYRIGPHLAVQFHPEAQVRQAIDWPAADPVNLAVSGQTATEIREQTERELPAARERAATLFDRFLEVAGLEGGRSAPTAPTAPTAPDASVPSAL